jgi:hypothetical protein
MLMVILSLALFIGCAKPPTAEMEKAEKAIAEAKAKEANLYAEEVFKKAEGALKSAQDFVTAKKYKEAKTAAEEAVTLAGQAVTEVETNKAKMKTEVEEGLANLQKELESLKALVVDATKKRAQINREEVQAAVGKAEVEVAAVKDLLQGGKVREAKDKLAELPALVKTQVDNLTAAVAAVPAAPARKR